MSEDAYTTVYGTKLPDDALPYDEQVFRAPVDINESQTTTLTLPRPSTSALAIATAPTCSRIPGIVGQGFQCHSGGGRELVGVGGRQGLDFQAASRPGLERRDALDRVRLRSDFRLTATPEHAWDFSWFYSFLAEGGIKNWSQVVAGELPPEELGVRAVDDLTLEIETEGVFPPLPGVMKFAYTLQKKALEEYGPLQQFD
ncbi:MAG: hypothetical protein R3A10_13180 [Caldilineaceae bacterium]